MMGNLLTALNMLEGARRAKSKRIFIYQYLWRLFKQWVDERTKMWDKNPSENDKFAGWAKRIGELQVEA